MSALEPKYHKHRYPRKLKKAAKQITEITSTHSSGYSISMDVQFKYKKRTKYSIRAVSLCEDELRHQQARMYNDMMLKSMMSRLQSTDTRELTDSILGESLAEQKIIANTKSIFI